MNEDVDKIPTATLRLFRGLCPREGDEIVSVTIQAGDSAVTLTPAMREKINRVLRQRRRRQ